MYEIEAIARVVLDSLDQRVKSFHLRSDQTVQGCSLSQGEYGWTGHRKRVKYWFQIKEWRWDLWADLALLWFYVSSISERTPFNYKNGRKRLKIPQRLLLLNLLTREDEERSGQDIQPISLLPLVLRGRQAIPWDRVRCKQSEDQSFETFLGRADAKINHDEGLRN